MSKKGEERERQRRMKVLEQARKSATKRSGPPKGEKVNVFKKTSNFLKDVRRELKKVSWPPRKETVSSTWVVLSVVFLFGFYFYIVDTLVVFLVRKLLTFGLN